MQGKQDDKPELYGCQHKEKHTAHKVHTILFPPPADKDGMISFLIVCIAFVVILF